MSDDRAPATNRDERYKQIVEEARFLLRELEYLDLANETDDLLNDWNSHVVPSAKRLSTLVWGRA